MKSQLFQALAGIASAVFALFLLLNYVAAAIQIQGNSMDPVLQNREKIIVLKMPISKYRIGRFDIIVFSHPATPERKLIKRVIGLPGEKLQISKGEIWINHRPVQTSAVNRDRPNIPFNRPMETVLIPENCFFVIGDNWGTSLDSRDFGPVHINDVIGKAFLRYWPFTRFGKIS